MIKDRSVSRSMQAVIVGRYKLIRRNQGRRLELYDMRTDPNERKNLAKSKPELVESLLKRIIDRRQIDAVPPF